MKKDLNGIYYASDYEPYRGGENVNFNKETGGYILDIKENMNSGINHFVEKIVEAFNKIRNFEEYSFILTCMPRSRENEVCPGMVNLLNRICNNYSNLEYDKCLNRYKTIPKKANGGIRSMDVELNSLEVCTQIRNKNIILFDDVTTTGNSLLAGSKKLKEAGADSVIKIALGKTVF